MKEGMDLFERMSGSPVRSNQGIRLVCFDLFPLQIRLFFPCSSDCHFLGLLSNWKCSE